MQTVGHLRATHSRIRVFLRPHGTQYLVTVYGVYNHGCYKMSLMNMPLLIMLAGGGFRRIVMFVVISVLMQDTSLYTWL